MDQYIEDTGMEAPEEHQDDHHAAYQAREITSLNLKDAGITSLVWATGYRYDFSWIRFPVFDQAGYPVQNRGVTSQPGLYFAGLHWLHNRKSGLFHGVGDDAEHIANYINQQD